MKPRNYQLLVHGVDFSFGGGTLSCSTRDAHHANPYGDIHVPGVRELGISEPKLLDMSLWTWEFHPPGAGVNVAARPKLFWRRKPGAWRAELSPASGCCASTGGNQPCLERDVQPRAGATDPTPVTRRVALSTPTL